MFSIPSEDAEKSSSIMESVLTSFPKVAFVDIGKFDNDPTLDRYGESAILTAKSLMFWKTSFE